MHIQTPQQSGYRYVARSVFPDGFLWPCRVLIRLWQCLAGFNKVTLVWNCSQSSMTVVGWPALSCSVVRDHWRLFWHSNWSHCVWRVTLAYRPPHPPTHPPTHLLICSTHDILCHVWKRLKNQQIQIAGTYTYDYLLVAIVLLCFSFKSYAGTVRHRRVMWHWIFQIGISQIFKCAHMHGWFLLTWSHIRMFSKFSGWSLLWTITMHGSWY